MGRPYSGWSIMINGIEIVRVMMVLLVWVSALSVGRNCFACFTY